MCITENSAYHVILNNNAHLKILISLFLCLKNLYFCDLSTCAGIYAIYLIKLIKAKNKHKNFWQNFK